jgi:hypothetical protein
LFQRYDFPVPGGVERRVARLDTSLHEDHEDPHIAETIVQEAPAEILRSLRGAVTDRPVPPCLRHQPIREVVDLGKEIPSLVEDEIRVSDSEAPMWAAPQEMVEAIAKYRASSRPPPPPLSSSFKEAAHDAVVGRGWAASDDEAFSDAPKPLVVRDSWRPLAMILGLASVVLVLLAWEYGAAWVKF